MSNLIIQMTGIRKTFGGVAALDQVSLNVQKGHIHAVVGENGAGKTTLMKILQGLHHADSGEVKVDGQIVNLKKAADAISLGIGMVSQHYSIIPELTCLQNLMLGNEPGAVLRLSESEKRATELAGRMGFQFDWQASSADLSAATGQKLEILKLLWREARIMILDEPTAMLSPADSDALYASLKQLTAEGATVIVVTHRISEVLQHCQRVTVLRNGKQIDERDVAGLDASDIAELIVGKSVKKAQTTDWKSASQLLNVSSLAVKGERGQLALKSVSFQVGEGEVLGIAGVDGSGQRELFQALMGVVASSGETGLANSTAARLADGLRLIPEDRLGEGVLEGWSLIDNAALGCHRSPELVSGNARNMPAITSFTERVAAKFHTKFGKIEDPIRSLSGGNQQRFVAGRAIESQAKLLLAFQPTRGLDIDATENVYQGIRDHCRTQKAAAIVVSFDLDELIEQCDRIVVMCNGNLSSPAPGLEKDRAEIGRLMVGA